MRKKCHRNSVVHTHTQTSWWLHTQSHRINAFDSVFFSRMKPMRSTSPIDVSIATCRVIFLRKNVLKTTLLQVAAVVIILIVTYFSETKNTNQKHSKKKHHKNTQYFVHLECSACFAFYWYNYIISTAYLILFIWFCFFLLSLILRKRWI